MKDLLLILIIFIMVGILVIKDKPEQIKVITYDDYTIHRMAQVIYAECGYCPATDKILIASSLINRMHSCDFPQDIDLIIKNQYVKADTFDFHSLKIAYMVYTGELHVDGVTYFYNPKTATDRTFINLMKDKELITKTQFHNYYKH